MSSYWIGSDRCWWQRSHAQNTQRSTGSHTTCWTAALSTRGRCHLVKKKNPWVLERSADKKMKRQAWGTEQNVTQRWGPIDASKSLCRTDQSLPQIAIDITSRRLIDQFHLLCVCVLYSDSDNLAASKVSPWRCDKPSLSPDASLPGGVHVHRWTHTVPYQYLGVTIRFLSRFLNLLLNLLFAI